MKAYTDTNILKGVNIDSNNNWILSLTHVAWSTQKIMLEYLAGIFTMETR